MNLEIGVVCGQCDAYSPMGTAHCPFCAHDLALFKPAAGGGRPATRPNEPVDPIARLAAQSGRAPPIDRNEPADRPHNQPPPPTQRLSRPTAPDVLDTPPPGSNVEIVRGVAAKMGAGQQKAGPEQWGHDTTGKIPNRGAAAGTAKGSGGKASSGRSKEELMEQAKNYVCRSCSTPIPSGHKFCGRCGAAVPPDILTLREEYYGSLQVPGRAKLILIRAEGDAAMEGLSFALNAQEHIVGRQGHLTFPEDRFVSPKHANLFYRDGKLVVRDEGSINGVYVRLRGSIDIQPGDMFLAGEEVFRIDATPKASDHPEPDGTYFWSSPKRPSPFRIVQVLQGGANGNVVTSREAGITIGREGGEMNFPTDVYMSATHCRMEADPSGAKFTLTDLNSRNGTYIRMRGERELAHGDYIFIGKKILRVEVTA